ncbi:MAG: flagellar basal body-associated FliL family protein [Pseudomonadota bacterium]
MADVDAKAADGTEQPKKKSKIMLFIILGFVILLLGGGGFFAYTKFLAPPPSAPMEEIVDQKAELLPAVGEIVPLDPFVVNLADPKGSRYLKMTISIEVETVETSERITKLAPKLRDIVIMMLTSLSFEEVMTPEGKLRIRDELLERFSRVTKPDKIKNIYFSEFVVQ